MESAHGESGANKIFTLGKEDVFFLSTNFKIEKNQILSIDFLRC